MRKKLIAFILTVLIAAGVTLPVSAEVDKFRLVNEVALFVAQNYKYGTTSEHLKNTALEYILRTGDTDVNNVLKEMFKDLDEYSTYFTPEEYSSFSTTLSASMCGIGATVTMGRFGAVIVELLPDSPAQKAGLLPYDIILSADGTELCGMDLDEAVKYIRGSAGSLVHLGVRHSDSDEIFYRDVVRGNVEQSTVFWKKITDDIAYLSLSSLTLNCDVFMRKALAEIDEAGIHKILFDLRDNGGGYLDATVNICNMLMPEGVVGYVDYRDPEKLETFYSDNKAPKYQMAVLINGATASGAEFLSGGLQDTGIGKLFGEQSFGKGTVQTTQALTNGAAFKVTTAKYYTAHKQDVAKNHINPDVVVKNSYQRVNEESFAALDFDAAVTVGSTGEAVRAIEQRLEALGFMDSADDVFDAESMEAIRQFRAYEGILPIAAVDFECLTYLNNIEYDSYYKTNDYQYDAALSYLEGLE